MWPMLLDTPKEECQRILRRLELEAYGSLVSALRGQGELSKSKRQLLQDAAVALHINTERHRAEIRRAVNDEKLATVAERISGPNTEMDWAIEGRRLVPLMPRMTPQTAFTALANNVANLAAAENAKLPPPQSTAKSPDVGEMEEAAAPESSRTTQNQGAAQTPLSTNTPQSRMTRGEEHPESRKRRRTSQEVIAISPTMQPPPAKIPASSAAAASAVGPVVTSRSISMPASTTQGKLAQLSPSVRTSTTSTAPQKVIIMSSTSGGMPVGSSPSLLQRSLSVPMVKTTASAAPGPSMTTAQAKMSPIQGSSSAMLSPHTTARIRPPRMTAATTVLPRTARATSSLVIPVSTNAGVPSTSGLNLRPITATSSKQTLHIKPDGSGMKIIAGTPKIMPKPPTVIATTSGGGTRMVTLTATPRVSSYTSAMPIASTIASPSIPQTVSLAGTPTIVSSKPLLSVSSGAASTAAVGKANVIVVKKGVGFTTNQGGVTLAPASRELLSKVVLRTSQAGTTVTPTKVQTQPQSNVAAAAGGGGGVAQTINLTSRSGNVIVLDVNQENLKGNTALSEFLQASGLLQPVSITTTPATPDKKDESMEDEEEQASPSSSTDTGSSLELNTLGVTSYEEDQKLSPEPEPRPIRSQLQARLTSVPTTTPVSRSQIKVLTTVPRLQRVPLPTAKYSVITIEDDNSSSSEKPTENKRVEPDMRKIEEQMLSLGEGAQPEEEKPMHFRITPVAKPTQPQPKQQELKPQQVIEEEIVDLEEVTLDLATSGGSNSEYQRAVQEACGSVEEEEEEVSQESLSVPEGELDPQTGIFCMGSDLQVSEESSRNSATEPSRAVDIYSEAISSANITFDSNSETEPEVVEPLGGANVAAQHSLLDSDEDLSLVYTDADDLPSLALDASQDSSTQAAAQIEEIAKGLESLEHEPPTSLSSSIELANPPTTESTTVDPSAEPTSVADPSIIE